MCAVDLGPFNIVNGAGFKNLAQSLIDVGAKYGDVKAEGVLPHASTVSRKTSVVADKVTSKFLPETKDAMRNGRCSLDAKMWSDKYSKTAYLTTTAQYVTENYELKSLVLFTADFPADEAKTGANIEKHSKLALEKLGRTQEEVAEVPHVTDEGSSLKVAYRRYNTVRLL